MKVKVSRHIPGFIDVDPPPSQFFELTSQEEVL
jgi:hypothetical protein